MLRSHMASHRAKERNWVRHVAAICSVVLLLCAAPWSAWAQNSSKDAVATAKAEAEAGFDSFARGDYVGGAEKWKAAIAVLHRADRASADALAARIAATYRLLEERKQLASPAVAGSMNALGGQFANLGRYQDAVPLFQRAYVIRTTLLGPEHPDTVTSTQNLARGYAQLGQLPAARKYFEQALAVQEKLAPEDTSTAQTLHDLATIYSSQGDDPGAIKLATRALEIFEKKPKGQRQNLSISLNNLGSLYERTDQPDKALPLLMRALDMERQLGPANPNIALSLINISRLQFSLGHRQESLRYILDALHYALRGDATHHAQVYNNMAANYTDLGKPEVAILYLKIAVNLAQHSRLPLESLDRRLQRSYLRAHERWYRRLAGLLIGAGRIPEAQEVLNMLKEEEYFDFIRREGTSDPRKTKSTYSSAESIWVGRIAELAAKIDPLASEIRRLQRGPRRRKLANPLKTSCWYWTASWSGSSLPWRRNYRGRRTRLRKKGARKENSWRLRRGPRWPRLGTMSRLFSI